MYLYIHKHCLQVPKPTVILPQSETVQAMHLWTQNAKTAQIRLCGNERFHACLGVAPSPMRTQTVFWVTHSAATQFLQITDSSKAKTPTVILQAREKTMGVFNSAFIGTGEKCMRHTPLRRCNFGTHVLTVFQHTGT